MENPPITETELREAVRTRLSTDAAKTGGRLFEELGIENGGARVDMALVGAQLHAFELKSDYDSFARMHNQIHAYGRVFDRVTLVTGPAFRESVLALAPPWWGAWLATRRRDGSLALRLVRKARANPAQDRLSMAMLLWRAECIEALHASTGERPPGKATRLELHKMVAHELNLRSLRAAVTHFLLGRQASPVRSTHVPTALPTISDSVLDALA